MQTPRQTSRLFPRKPFPGSPWPRVLDDGALCITLASLVASRPPPADPELGVYGRGRMYQRAFDFHPAWGCCGGL